jgi:hypothetical protein
VSGLIEPPLLPVALGALPVFLTGVSGIGRVTFAAVAMPYLFA